MTNNKLQSCIDACLDCATACDSCATKCLHEQDIAMLTRCIELDKECAEACYACARLMSIGENTPRYSASLAQKYATPVPQNVKNMLRTAWITAVSVPSFAESAQRNVEH